MANSLFQVIEHPAVSLLELTLPPEMDPLLVDKLIDSVIDLLEGRTGRPWVLDLSKVNYLNSAGLGLLCNIRQKIKQSQGKLVLCGLSPPLMEVFRSCCLERLFLIVKSRPEALVMAAK